MKYSSRPGPWGQSTLLETGVIKGRFVFCWNFLIANFSTLNQSFHLHYAIIMHQKRRNEPRALKIKKKIIRKRNKKRKGKKGLVVEPVLPRMANMSKFHNH